MTCIPADTAAHPRIVIGCCLQCRATGLSAVEVILESWWRNMIVLLLSSTHFLQEGDERHESIIVSGIAELLHETLGFLLAELLSEVGEEKEKLVLQDGVVVIFVVQLHDLNKVVEASLVLGVLAFLEHGEDFGLGQDLLSLFLCSSDGLDGLHGGVDVAGPHQVASIEGIDLAVTLEVIDIEGEVKSFDFLLLESKLGHGVSVGD